MFHGDLLVYRRVWERPPRYGEWDLRFPGAQGTKLMRQNYTLGKKKNMDTLGVAIRWVKGVGDPPISQYKVVIYDHTLGVAPSQPVVNEGLVRDPSSPQNATNPGAHWEGATPNGYPK